MSAYLALLSAWGVLGFVALLKPGNLFLTSRVLFPLGALIGVALAAAALANLQASPEQCVLALGLPDLPFHLRRDALTDVFVFLLGSVSAGISLFGAGYFRSGEGTAPGLMCLQYFLFL